MSEIREKRSLVKTPSLQKLLVQSFDNHDNKALECCAGDGESAVRQSKEALDSRGFWWSQWLSWFFKDAYALQANSLCPGRSCRAGECEWSKGSEVGRGAVSLKRKDESGGAEAGEEILGAPGEAYYGAWA